MTRYVETTPYRREINNRIGGGRTAQHDDRQRRRNKHGKKGRESTTIDSRFHLEEDQLVCAVPRDEERRVRQWRRRGVLHRC